MSTAQEPPPEVAPKPPVPDDLNALADELGRRIERHLAILSREGEQSGTVPGSGK
ncbi:hypothetical protein [Streptomyces sp. G45]|uniref:hypothetical protein n=1 Tax=Streptomyces sp. G45 TaxID=3406627 RepID=UPI003C22DEB2